MKINETETPAQWAHSLLTSQRCTVAKLCGKKNEHWADDKGNIWDSFGTQGRGCFECFLYFNSFKPPGTLVYRQESTLWYYYCQLHFKGRKTEAQSGLVTCSRSHSYYMGDLRFEPTQPGSQTHSLNLHAPLCPLGTSWILRKKEKVLKAEGQAIAKFQNLKRAGVEERGSTATISKATEVQWDVRMRNRDYHSVILA